MCRNGSTCVDRHMGYICICPPGLEGTFCEVNIDECLTANCQNNATCVDLFNDYRCDCLPGWTGKDCESDIPECSSNPCLNNGTCFDNVDGFVCNCPPFYTGQNCSLSFDPCDPTYDPCENGATCLTNQDGTYSCSCIPGFTGMNCETNMDDCVPDPCQNGARCEDQVNDYVCHCLPGFTGKNCQTDIDDCLPGICQNGATCLDLVDGYNCSCAPGYTGQNCSEDIDECASSPCENGATCRDLIGQYECDCFPGFEGQNCASEVDECSSAPCVNGATCRDLLNGYDCTCAEGFTGTDCEVNIDDCVPDPCVNGVCQDSVNSYNCVCAPGWTGENCTVDIDECSNNPCQNGGTCTDRVNGFTCACSPGYTGPNCTFDINVCEAPGFSQCQNGGSCVDGPGNNFTCSCMPGYAGPYCEVDVNECNSDPCQNGATCQDLINGFNCNCTTGWTGETCADDTDECSSDPCQNNGVCQQLAPGSGYRCFCPPGIQGDNCEVNFDDCFSDPCQNGATCVDAINGYACSCAPGYNGTHCEIDIDECSSSPCQNGANCTQPYPGVYECLCLDGFAGINCEHNDTCINNLCQNGATCVAYPTNYTCVCAAGFTGTFCDVVTTTPETTLTPSPVPTITPTPTPTPVYTCQDDPCQNGATCTEEVVNGQTVARCECTWWYTGQFCNSVRIVTPKFLTNSYLEFPAYTVQESNTIQVSFRTAHENGTLLYAVQDYRTPQAAAYFIHLYVENGVLYYHFSCFIERFLVDTNALVNHGNEVSVTIEHISRPGCQATVTIDNGIPAQAGRPTYFFNNVGEQMGPVYMGGVPPTFDPLISSLPVYDFQGCVSELIINAVPYDFLYSLVGENVEECDVLPTPLPGPTVPPPPTCSETRCENGGTCRDVTTGGVLQFECDCRLHFTGDRCEQDLVVYFPSFSGNTYLQYAPLDLTQQYTNNIVVMFKTTATDATILYAAEDDGIAGSVGANSDAEFVHLYIEDGTLWYRQSRPRPIGNNIRGMCSASVQVNGSAPVSNEVRTYFAQKSLGPLYLGGLPSDLTAVPTAALNITRPSFTGEHFGYSSYVAYPQVLGLNFFFEVRFSFALANNDSALTSSLMLYTGQANQVPGWGDDYLALGIENGHVVLTFDLGSGPAYIRSSSPLDLTLPYHTVTLGRESKVGWLSVDSAANVTGESQGDLIGLNLAQGEQLFLGGYDMFQLALMPNTVNFTSGFQGCIYDMEVRTRPSDVWQTVGHVQSGRMVGQCSVSECALNTCHNRGTCVDMGASFRCECQAGWKGLLCADEETVCDTTSPCAAGASCVPLGQAYRCDCPLGTNGTDCRQSVTISDPSFGTRGQGSISFMSFPRQNLRVETQIVLEFQPGAQNGILFYAAQNLNSRAGDFISLSLFDGFVEFRYNLGLEPTAVIRSGQRINTSGNTWYVLEAGRTGKDGYLRINGEEVTGATNQAMVGLDIRTDFYLGGVPYLDLVANMAVEDDPSGFVGCVRRLAVNAREYDLTENGATEGMNVGDCDGTACGSNVCRNNGVCQPIGISDFSCDCVQPYVGETCEEQASCANHGCRNNATCVATETPGGHTCACGLGWEGENCTDAITFQSARFEGDGHIFYQDPDHALRNPTITQLSLNFTSTQGEGLILWNGKTDTDDEDYMGLGVRDGKLLFSINLGYLAKETIQSTADVDDGLWHSVIIQRSRRVVTMYLDGQPYPAVNGIDVGGASVGLNTDGLFHIGGFELGANVTVSTFGLYTAGLTGCVRDVILYRDSSAVSLAQADRGNNVYSCDGR
uniref:Uncharacterized protein n=1 Tax=Branchiostoma floridae TaxID=7739 RepID=C3ZMG6_BRAFL|eukprot:XP_002590250.1 hypothetical protein BRAFLDRAFT_132333 [Branchiostoma floridae]